MNKKIVLSLATVAVVATAAVSGTIAYFSDVEKSSGNVIVTGNINLTVDHTKQTYNGVDCEACVAEVVSGIDDKIVAWREFGTGWVSFGTPWNAVEVTPVNNWNILHDSSSQAIPWIWGDNHPNGFEGFRFQKTFDWTGSATTATVTLELSADNTYSVKMNGNTICADMSNSSSNYTDTQTCDIPSINSGTNVLAIEVTNEASGWWENNPAGLTYKLTIDGNCDDPDSYFGQHCQLWADTNLTNQKFFDFDDVKPGDSGTNVISLHTFNNPAWACMSVQKDANASDPDEKISSEIYIKLWKDDGDGILNGTETLLTGAPIALKNLTNVALFDSATSGGQELATGTPAYIGLAWCAGQFNTDGTCDVVSMGNEAQGQKYVADLVLEAIQTRHNGQFVCSNHTQVTDLEP